MAPLTVDARCSTSFRSHHGRTPISGLCKIAHLEKTFEIKRCAWGRFPAALAGWSLTKRSLHPLIPELAPKAWGGTNMKRFCCLMIVAIMISSGGVANAQSLPSYMAPIAGPTSATPADIATKDVLAL